MMESAGRGEVVLDDVDALIQQLETRFEDSYVLPPTPKMQTNGCTGAPNCTGSCPCTAEQ